MASERAAFVEMVREEEVPIAELCRQFGISRKTGYKWLARAQTGESLADRSRRPHTSPRQIAGDLEARILALRQQHPAWGGRKLHHRLVAAGVADVPAPSTITDVLRRAGMLEIPPAPSVVRRFAHTEPNALWQMDFMGHQPLRQGRVHPWSLLDDHSRFALDLAACPNQQRTTVQTALTTVFRRYGLPQAILCDNGSPWGAAGLGGITRLEAWLLRLGVEPWHGRPYHPQTQGKVERFHGTIAREVFAQQRPMTLMEAQAAFDAFRTNYNHQRPHEALAHLVPASAYQPSLRPFPEVLPPVVYDDGELVVTVTLHGSISWRGRRRFISRGLVGEPVALRPTEDPAVWSVIYCEHQVATIDLRSPEEG
ncbi:MAG: IS481 family transposase [Chloroflexota bacterium]|nr:IS481 family transposase [Chloroflexota bacterium]